MKTDKKTAPGRPFEKGVGGNPSGRPKLLPGFTEAMRALSPRAIEILVETMEGKPGASRDRAVEMVLAYAWGKPKQQVEVSGEDGGPIGFQVIRRVIIDPSAGHTDP